MAEERKVLWVQFDPTAAHTMRTAIVRDCLAKGVGKDDPLASRYTEMANGDLRVRTFRGESLISEVVIEKSLWKEVTMQ